MSPRTILLPALAAALLHAAPAHACGLTRTETMIMMAIALPILGLLVSPLLLLGHDLIRLPFGWRPGRRGALVRAVLGAGGAAVGFWGGVFNAGSAQPGLLAYGAACAALLSYSATIALTRKAN
jgi:hypothetical protein